MTFDTGIGRSHELTYREKPSHQITAGAILSALCFLVLMTFGVVAYDALKDHGAVCHIKVDPGPRGWRTLYCPPGAVFDSVAVDEPWQPKGYP